MDGNDTFQNVAFFQGSAFNDVFDASAYAGQNAFEGMGGNDTIYGNGQTNLYFTHAGSSVSINLADGTANGASTGSDTFSNLYTFQGSSFNDVFDARGFGGFKNMN